MPVWPSWLLQEETHLGIFNSRGNIFKWRNLLCGSEHWLGTMPPACPGGVSPHCLWTDWAAQRTATLSSSKTQGTHQQLSNKGILTEGAPDLWSALDFRQTSVVCLICTVEITVVSRRRVQTEFELMSYYSTMPCHLPAGCSACGKYTLFQLTIISTERSVKFMKYYLCSISRP